MIDFLQSIGLLLLGVASVKQAQVAAREYRRLHALEQRTFAASIFNALGTKRGASGYDLRTATSEEAGGPQPGGRQDG